MNTQIQEAATKWWETLTVEEIATIYLKEHESKEETVSVSVEEAAIKHDKIANALDSSHRLSFETGANWQKEQDKAIISELLEALELANGTLGSCLIMEEEVQQFLNTENIRKDRSQIFSAITKATNYLNK